MRNNQNAGTPIYFYGIEYRSLSECMREEGPSRYHLLKELYDQNNKHTYYILK